MSTLEMNLTNFSHCIEYGARSPNYETDIPFARTHCANEHRRVRADSNAALHSTRTPAAASIILTAIARDDPTCSLFLICIFGYYTSARSLRAAVARQAHQYSHCYLNRIMPGITRRIVSSGFFACCVWAEKQNGKSDELTGGRGLSGSATVTQIQLPHESDNDGAPGGQQYVRERYRAGITQRSHRAI
jgi:hypothetical protein